MTRVLLYSGGLDSTAMGLLWPHDIKLYVDMHTRYSMVEINNAVEHGAKIVDFPLGKWERDDGIIPLRNLFLVAVASIFGERIALGAIAGERMLDKTPAFAQGASDLLSYLWSEGEPGRRPQGWTPGKPVQVELPLVDLAKDEIIARVIEAGHDPAKLAYDSWSCYSPEGTKQCGKCKPCVRNWLAFWENGVSLPYDARPYLTDYLEGRGRESEIARRAYLSAQ